MFALEIMEAAAAAFKITGIILHQIEFERQARVEQENLRRQKAVAAAQAAQQAIKQDNKMIRVLSAQQVERRYLDTKDGYNSNATIVSQETSACDDWICEVFPNDNGGDGTEDNSSTLTVACGETEKPNITFVTPTPGNDTRRTSNSEQINVTVEDDTNVSSCLLEWDG